MTHHSPEPQPLDLEARLDGLGRAMASESHLIPLEFLSAVRHRRQAIAFKRVGTACAAALALFVVVFLIRNERARWHEGSGGPGQLTRAATMSPTFANLRAVGDVNALPLPSFGAFTPVPRAGERTDAQVAKDLTEFK